LKTNLSTIYFECFLLLQPPMLELRLSSVISLICLSSIYFLENYDRYLLASSPVPFVDYSSIQYALLSGTMFSLFYTAGGISIALLEDSSFQKNGTMNVTGKWNSRAVVLAIACFIFSITFAMTAFATSFWQLACIRMIMGLSQSVVTPFSTGIISECFSHSHRGIAFGVFNVGLYLAFSLSLSLGTYIYDQYGWRMGYLMFGLIGILVSLLLPIFVRTPADATRKNIPLSISGGHTSQEIVGPESCDNPMMSQSTISVCISSDSLLQEADQRNPPTMDTIQCTSSSSCMSLPYSERSSQDEAQRDAIRSGTARPQKSVFDNKGYQRYVSLETDCEGSLGFSGSEESSQRMESSLSSATFTSASAPTLAARRVGPVFLATAYAYAYFFLLAAVNGFLYCHRRVKAAFSVLRLVFRFWRSRPSIFWLCAATGIRLGGGFIWSAYTSVFFSDLFVGSLGSSHRNGKTTVAGGSNYYCSASYNSTFVSSQDGQEAVASSWCSAKYPYCVDGTCRSLRKSPWHNKVQVLL
jgi:MFS family permease